MPDPRKDQLVVDWSTPLILVQDAKKFRGLTKYIRKNNRGYGAVSAPI